MPTKKKIGLLITIFFAFVALFSIAIPTVSQFKELKLPNPDQVSSVVGFNNGPVDIAVSEFSSVRSGWLGLATDWDKIESDPNAIVNQIANLNDPWVYDWKAEHNRYDLFGDSFTPMIWGCSGSEAKFRETMDKALNWPNPNHYILFLNEPDMLDQVNCAPELAAKRLHLLLTDQKKKPETKVLVVGTVKGTSYISQFLAAYRNLYTVNPEVQGLHLHIYAHPAYNKSLAETTADEFFENAKSQLAEWRNFTTQQEPWLADKEFWITETGILYNQTPTSTVVPFMEKWLDYLSTQTFVTRAYWFVNNIETNRAPSVSQHTAGALHVNMQPNVQLLQKFADLCDKYCPAEKTTYCPGNVIGEVCEVNMQDLLALMSHIVEERAFTVKYDIDKNGLVGITDLLFILNIIR